MILSRKKINFVILMWLASLLLIFLSLIFGYFKLIPQFFLFLLGGITLLLLNSLRFFHLIIQNKLDEIISLLKELVNKSQIEKNQDANE